MSSSQYFSEKKDIIFLDLSRKNKVQVFSKKTSPRFSPSNQKNISLMFSQFSERFPFLKSILIFEVLIPR